MDEFEKIRNDLAEKYKEQDFKENPNGYTVAPYCNEETTSTAFECGFDAGYNYALQSKIVTDLVFMLKQYKEEFLCEETCSHCVENRRIYEQSCVALQNYESQIKKMGEK